MRLLCALGGGAAVTLVLFWMMQAMIAADAGLGGRNENTRMIEFVRFDREPQTNVRQRTLPEKPKLQNRPTAPAMTSAAEMPRPEVPEFAMALPSIELPVEFSGAPSLEGMLPGPPAMAGAAGGGDGELIPLVRIAPLYPRVAQMRSLEGEVKVEFTITETGAVRDPTVIESNPPGIFDRAALEAIMRWKFKPKMEDGQTVPHLASQTITFELND